MLHFSLIRFKADPHMPDITCNGCQKTTLDEDEIKKGVTIPWAKYRLDRDQRQIPNGNLCFYCDVTYHNFYQGFGIVSVVEAWRTPSLQASIDSGLKIHGQ